jgi:hypothetical protein
MAKADRVDTLPRVPSFPWSRILAGALLLHVAWGVVRLPKVHARRQDDVRAHRELGAAAAHFAANRLAGADAIPWVLASTPPDRVVAWTGSETGAIEFAAALLWPRLLVHEARLHGDQHAGRPIATGTRDGRTGRIVITAERLALRVEVR